MKIISLVLIFTLGLYSTGNVLAAGAMTQVAGAQGAVPGLSSATDTTNDRKANFNQAGQQAQDGQAAANAAGTTLTAIGTPMTQSLDLPTQIAGYQLLAMAATEFAQGAQSGNSAQGDYARANALTQDTGTTGSQNTAANNSATAASTIPPAIAEQLAQNGLDAQQLLNGLQDGSLSTPQAVAGFFGADPNFSPSDLAAAQGILDTQLATALPGMVAPNSLSFDDSSNTSNSSSGGSGSAGAGGGGGGSRASSGFGTDDLSSVNNKTNAAAATPSATKPANNPLATELGLSGLNDDAIKTALANYGVPLSDDSQKSFLIGQGLEAMGVGVPLHNQNIFQKVHARAESFGRWRKKWIKEHRLAKN